MSTLALARRPWLVSAVCAGLALGCGHQVDRAAPTRAAAAATSCEIVLAPVDGSAGPDPEIDRAQQRARRAPDPVPYLERLGWAWVAKARSSHDPGFLTLALETASCIEVGRSEALEALLLRGHALASLHRFREAEMIGRVLVARRGAWFDHALLGDALLDQGHVDEAIEAYERVMAIRPGPQAYSRAALVRWIVGDLEGAIEAMELAARASDGRDPSSAAWFRSRLAQYELAAGRRDRAQAWLDSALALEPDHPPALLARGLALLAAGRAEAAIVPLARAVAVDPLPEQQWALAEALRDAGRASEAAAVEARLVERGEAEDPRTLALFLATTGRDAARALRLASRELETRQDVLTLDAMALALAAVGRTEEARSYSERALARGTRSARLHLHAAAIAAAAGDASEAARRAAQAKELAHTLLPSERRRLDVLLAATKTHPRAAVRS